MPTANERFSEWLAFRGLSQEKAAALLECSQATISNLCGTATNIRLTLAVRIQRETANWSKGPIFAHEWVPDISSFTHSENVTPPASPAEASK